MVDGLCIQPRTGGPWLGLPAEPWRERKSFWLWREAGRYDQRTKERDGWRTGLRPASPAELVQLARSFARVPGVAVELFGAPADSSSGEPTESTVTGVLVRPATGQGRAVLLPGGALGDCEPAELDAAGVASATALGVLCARRAAPQVLQASCSARMASAATCASWAGPMLCYSGGAPSVQAWDQSKAYLRAWDQLWPVAGQPMELVNPHPRIIENPSTVGFALVEIEEPGPYPSIPAAVMGDMWRCPLRGRSVVPVSIWALRELLIPAGLRVLNIVATVATGGGGNIPFRREWEDIGCSRKAVYQRVFSGLAPGERWIGRPDGRDGWRWTRQDPDAMARPDFAALGRWAVAGRTAAALHQLGARGGQAVASHIDCIFEADSGDANGFQLPEIVTPGEWALKASGSMRCYGPGRYDLAGQEARMGGPGGAERGDEDLYLRARIWAGDPRSDADAFSDPLDADPASCYFSYSFGDRVHRGRHGAPGVT